MIERSRVSILILLDYLFLFRDREGGLLWKEFQSLFYWITYSYHFHQFWQVLQIKFQSLFYWITYSYNPDYYLEIKGEECFNPYFTGLPILIIYYYIALVKPVLFQSLFYWITYSYPHVKRWVGRIGLMFQSLFYWITYSYDACSKEKRGII